MAPPRITVVMLAYGPEPYLVDAARAALASTDVTVELIVVDNGCTGGGIDAVKTLPRVRVLSPEHNTGYAGGCDVGAAEATGDWLAFVNSDAIVAPDALAKVTEVAAEDGVGAAMASIRLADRPELINTAGNPLHFAGLSWAGGNGEPATVHAHRRSVATLSGCCFVIGRRLWRELDGFAPEYFAYHEDTELSLRLRQRGLRLEYVPDAVVRHHYEFSRNTLKLYLVERNRLVTLLTTYQTRTLAVLAPALLLTEAAMLTNALTAGWARHKIRGWRWLWQHRGWVRSRRRQLQAERRVPDGVIADLMTGRLPPTDVTATGLGAFNAVAGAYWAVAKPLLKRT
ncbi:glycosyltransferase family 2 protein [Micromonospora sp. WMMD961]|uniref:glycosyltransferase family 2 protein n=1 Tax=Micromonospora sp. WMMD961 TaxID=3016100 RepID=UPI0024178392|nr:glycosyltransferase family 2 protein [Micromonospora sp. WMMD961]MDG4781312.1 glycosyltransferase family 2 protein [Micromonospora sp. WMMD961]